MPYVVEWKSWTEKNPEGHIVYKATAKVDTSIESEEWLEAAVKQIYTNYATLWTKIRNKLGREVNFTEDRALIKEMNDWLAKELREAYGRDPFDASRAVQLKTIDMAAAAVKRGMTPGSDNGWELEILKLIEEGKIK